MAGTVELTEVERWFLARGIPHFIADYDRSTRVWTRALPALLVLYLLAALPYGASTWRDAGVEFAISAACVLAAWVVSNLARRRPPFERPRRVGRVELAVFVLGPTVGHLLAGQWVTAAVVAAVQLLLLGGAYVVTSYALFPLVSWTLRRSVDSLRVVGAATVRALPLLLLVVMFFFLTAEVWQVFARLQGLPYGIALLLFLVSGSAFVAKRAQNELRDVEPIDDWDSLAPDVEGTPAAALAAGRTGPIEGLDGTGDLGLRQRINLTMVIVVNQVILSVVVAGAIGLFFVVFGFLAIGREVIEAWVLHPPNPLWTVHLSGRTLMLSEELIRVSGFLAVFSGFYFGVYSTTNPEMREGLDDFAEANLRQLFAVRRVYLATRT